MWNDLACSGCVHGCTVSYLVFSFPPLFPSVSRQQRLLLFLSGPNLMIPTRDSEAPHFWPAAPSALSRFASTAGHQTSS